MAAAVWAIALTSIMSTTGIPNLAARSALEGVPSNKPIAPSTSITPPPPPPPPHPPSEELLSIAAAAL